MPVQLIPTALVTQEEIATFVWQQPSSKPAEDLDVLLRITNAVSRAIVRRIGPVVEERIVDERHDGGGQRLFLHRRPVRAIESCTENGVVLAEGTDFAVYPGEGVLLRLVGGVPANWAKGPQAISVTYRAGRCVDTASVPEDLKLACKLWVYRIYHSTAGNRSNVVNDQDEVPVIRMPVEVADLLRPYAQVRAG